jgi:hypothetical protein
MRRSGWSGLSDRCRRTLYFRPANGCGLGAGNGLPDHRPVGPDGVLPVPRGPVAPRRPGLPALRPGRRDGRPGPTPGAGVGLPLPALWPGVQRLHRHGAGANSPIADPMGAHPPGRRPGNADRSAGPRDRLRPDAPAGTATSPAGTGSPSRGLGRSGARPRGRSRRDVPECGGKKASRTRTRPTRRVAGATSAAGTARSEPTGRRCSGSSAAGPARSSCGSPDALTLEP